jgi:hypothetical protein
MLALHFLAVGTPMLQEWVKGEYARALKRRHITTEAAKILQARLNFY